jgi:magnesium transporter
MISYFPGVSSGAHGQAPAKAFWVDLIQPTAQESARIESEFNVRIPSADQLKEIESSSRLRTDGIVMYLSMPLIAHGDQADAAPGFIGFVLTADVLVTVRYAELHTFDEVRARLQQDPKQSGSTITFTLLLEAMVDFAADLLELIGGKLGATSRQVFRAHDQQPRQIKRATRMLREMLTVVGDAGERLSQIRESLLGLQRIIVFTSDTACEWLRPEIQTRLKTVRRDVSSLTDYETHLSGKVQFLLDAILGFINTEQNEIFKVLTIVSVVGIPPTLIASMYGMNFHNMPELSWHWGYQYGLALIAVSTVTPILWFKWRGWW